MKNIRPVTTDDIIRLMNSDDYKDRMAAEIIELRNRTDKLYKMVIKYRAGRLDFTPYTPLYLLEKQLKHMQKYLYCLEIMAALEGVEI